MNNEYPHIIESDEQITPKNRFPIILQLGILGLIMIGLFGTIIFNGLPSNQTDESPTPDFSIEKNQQPLVPQKIEGVSVRAAAAYVWDVKAQRALYNKNAEEKLPLASITKLMTTLVAYELIADDKMTTVPLSAIKQDGSSGLSAGEKLQANKLRELALVSSSNDAAYALAASVGTLLGDKDPTSQFVRGMNIRAAELNLPTLEFWNTTGLDLSTTEPGAIGSAKDVSFLMEYIITQYPELLEPTQQTATRIYNTAGAYHEASNTNEVALKIPNMIGSKTGYTDLAGGNLTIAFDAGLNRPIIITVLGSTRDDRFTDVLSLVEAVQESLGQTQ